MSSDRDAGIEHALRATVRRGCAAGELDNLTVRRIREMVEVEMGLEEGFLKEEGRRWRERSKRVITEEVDACTDTAPSSQLQHVPAESTLEEGGKRTEAAAEPEEVEGRKARKRNAVDEGRAKKRRRKNQDEDEVEDEGDNSAFEEEHVDVKDEQNSSPHSKKRRAISAPPSPSRDGEAETNPNRSGPRESKAYRAAPQDSDSEMSVLIDESPKKKGRPRAKKSESAKQEKSSAPKQKKQQKQKQERTSTKVEGPADPDQEEIKRLQGWLVKCGIRKMWWKELQPYESPKSKIKHLKEMLAEAGMSGRYSVEKASQIREERELKADLEAVQEGAKIWGKAEDDGGGGRQKRQVAKGLQGLDFLNDEDGEETD